MQSADDAAMDLASEQARRARRAHLQQQVALATSLVLGGRAVAAGRDVELVVPYAPGGLLDSIARRILPELVVKSGTPMRVANIAGASGSIGLRYMLDAPADRLAVLTDSDSLVAPLMSPTPRIRPADFRLLCLLASGPYLLVSGPDGPRTGAELFATARLADWKIGNLGIGSASHLLATEFAGRMNVDAVHIPYKGLQPLLQDLAGRQANLAFIPVAGALHTIRAFNLQPLVSTSSGPVQAFPHLPRFLDQPIFSDFTYESWTGIACSVRMTERSSRSWANSLAATLEEATIQEFFRGLGATPAYSMTPHEIKAFYRGAIQSCLRLVNRARRSPST